MQKQALRSGILKIGKTCAAILVGLWAVGLLTRGLLASGDLAHRNSEFRLLWSASQRACTNIDHFMDAAEELGLKHKQGKNQWSDEQFREAFPEVKTVWVEPAVPFGDEVEAYLFDKKGCLGGSYSEYQFWLRRSLGGKD